MAAAGDSVEVRANLSGVEAVHHGCAREYAGVNISHEFRLACEQNRSTSQRDSSPFNYCPVMGMIIDPN